MDEMTFRSRLLTRPQHLDHEMLDYLEANPEQKSVVQNAREFDRLISESLDVEVPEGLQARILLKQSYSDKPETQEDTGGTEVISFNQETFIEEVSKSVNKPITVWKMNWLYGMVASFLIVAVGLNLLVTNGSLPAASSEAIVNHIVEHIQEEPSLMRAVKLPKNDLEMDRLFAQVGAQLNQPVEGMSYAGMCVIEGQKGLHIVMQQNGQPVTVIVMPGQQLAAMEAFNKSDYHGELIPVKGGVVAIVANSMEQVALAQIRFFKAVRFV